MRVGTMNVTMNVVSQLYVKFTHEKQRDYV